MAEYWMTFRIHEDAGYSTRYDAMMDSINELGTGFWDKPTSFIAMESEAGISGIASNVKAKLGPKDFFMIREITKDNVRYVGDPGEGFLYFFPKRKKGLMHGNRDP